MNFKMTKMTKKLFTQHTLRNFSHSMCIIIVFIYYCFDAYRLFLLLFKSLFCVSNLFFLFCYILIFQNVINFSYLRKPKFGIFLTLVTCLVCNVTLGILTYLRKYPLTYALYYNDKRE